MSTIDIRKDSQVIDTIEFSDQSSMGHKVFINRNSMISPNIVILGDSALAYRADDYINAVSYNDLTNLIKALQKVESILKLENC